MGALGDSFKEYAGKQAMPWILALSVFFGGCSTFHPKPEDLGFDELDAIKAEVAQKIKTDKAFVKARYEGKRTYYITKGVLPPDLPELACQNLHMGQDYSNTISYSGLIGTIIGLGAGTGIKVLTNSDAAVVLGAVLGGAVGAAHGFPWNVREVLKRNIVDCARLVALYEDKTMRPLAFGQSQPRGYDPEWHKPTNKVSGDHQDIKGRENECHNGWRRLGKGYATCGR